MKRSDKIILFLLFLGVNLIALYFISTFFNIGYGILTCLFTCVFASIDFVKRRQNVKILKAQREQIELEKKKREEEIQRQKIIKEEKKKKAIKKQQRLREHSAYRGKK